MNENEKYNTTILIKLPKYLKEKAIDKAYSERCNLSEYIRKLINKDLGNI